MVTDGGGGGTDLISSSGNLLFSPDISVNHRILLINGNYIYMYNNYVFVLHDSINVTISGDNCHFWQLILLDNRNDTLRLLDNRNIVNYDYVSFCGIF